MRLAVQCQSIVPGNSAGIEHFVYGLLSGLSSVDGDVELHVTIPRGSRATWEERRASFSTAVLHEIAATATIGVPASRGQRSYGATFRKLLTRSQTARRAVRQARLRVERNELRALRPDVVYYPFHRSDGGGTPAVVTAHDLRVLQPDFFDDAEARRLEANMRRAAAVVTSWSHPYRQLLDAYPWLEPKLHRIPIAPLVRCGPVDGEADEHLLLYAASTNTHKNHVRLIEAVALLRTEQPVRLVCAGICLEPGYSAALQRATELGLSDAVTFTGFVTDGELRELYARAGVVVAPTLWEAASGTVLEGLAYRKPIACSDIPPLRSQVEDLGGAARFFDPLRPDDIADAVREIWRDPTPYVRGSENAGATLASLSWNATARAYLDVFHLVAALAPKEAA
jgi:glycosyltransferase involved in cell wall biosynthesis